jgi:hypothetical protein
MVYSAESKKYLDTKPFVGVSSATIERVAKNEVRTLVAGADGR